MYNKPLIHTSSGSFLYFYGIFIAIGIAMCLGVFYLYTKKKHMPTYVQDFAFFVAIIAIVFGFLAAKFGQAVYDWIANGFKDFDFMGAGITAMVGFIGGAAAFLLIYFVGGNIYFKGKKQGVHIQEFNKILLVAPCCITIAHAFGRIGCLFAGCCHGKYLGKQYVVGGIYMTPSGSKAGYYVPTQLYEALFLFALFGLLTFLYFKRSNILMQIYLMAYGAWRIFIEFFRDDYRGGGNTLGLSPSQWQSILFIVGGAAMLVIYKLLKQPFILSPPPVDDEPILEATSETPPKDNDEPPQEQAGEKRNNE